MIISSDGGVIIMFISIVLIFVRPLFPPALTWRKVQKVQFLSKRSLSLEEAVQLMQWLACRAARLGPCAASSSDV